MLILVLGVMRVQQQAQSLCGDDDDNDDDNGLPAAADDKGEDAIAQSRISSLYSICSLLLFYRSAIDKAMRRLEVGDVIYPEENL